MKLPNGHLAVVDQRKITDYLLNPAHPDNGGKAAYFTAAGFTVNRWHALADALRAMAIDLEASAIVQSEHGTKYVIDGEMVGPNRNSGRVRSIWIIDSGMSNPRLVTAYPPG